MRPVVCLSVLVALLAPRPAAALAQRDIVWSLPQTWTSAIRLLRLDLGFEITERDRDAGFLLFRYVDGAQRHPGSLQMVERALPDGRTGVRVVVSVPEMPSYVEQHIIDRLERKLREEVGEPPPVPAPTSPAPVEEPEETASEEPPEDEPPETSSRRRR